MSRSNKTPTALPSAAASQAVASEPIMLEFANNRLLPELYGAHSQNLTRIEAALDVSLANRGNQIFVSGAGENCSRAKQVLHALYQKLERGGAVADGDVDGALRLSLNPNNNADGRDVAQAAAMPMLRTARRQVQPRSPRQADYITALGNRALVVAAGPAGTGKTYLAVAMAASMLVEGKVDRLILSRPAVEAGERLGFLPGDMRDKVDPYLRPLYDALYDMLPPAQVARSLESGEIEIAPLAFMRGRTLSNAYIILDEAQNATSVQMKMFLTRMGENSRMVITGDPSQVDLPFGAQSGLKDALEILPTIKDVDIIRFGETDVVRHNLVTRIVKAYNRRDKDMYNKAMYNKAMHNKDSRDAQN